MNGNILRFPLACKVCAVLLHSHRKHLQTTVTVLFGKNAFHIKEHMVGLAKLPDTCCSQPGKLTVPNRQNQRVIVG